jgi:lipopolysaccharide export system permease protein
MTTTLDRMVLFAFFRSYLIVWTCFISLYVVIDLFTHLDAYMNRPGGFAAIARYIVLYYGYRIPEVFNVFPEAITLVAATFTVAWMQKNNELLPQLSAGIPTRRIIRPVLLGAAVTLTFAPMNQEFLIPEIADELIRSRDDQEGAKAQVLMGAYDTSGVHIEGQAGFRRDRKIEHFYATFPENSPSGMVHLSAGDAYYIPPGDGPLTGGWMLTNTTPETFAGPTPKNLTVLGTGRCFLKVESADFDTVARGGTWYVHASTGRLREMLTGAEPRRQVKMAVHFHTRVTRPFAGALLVLLGVSVILRDPNRHVILSAGLCLVVGFLFYACFYGCKALGDADYVTPPLAAWLPVMIYGPLALVSFDAVHT